MSHGVIEKSWIGLWLYETLAKRRPGYSMYPVLYTVVHSFPSIGKTNYYISFFLHLTTVEIRDEKSTEKNVRQTSLDKRNNFVAMFLSARPMPTVTKKRIQDNGHK